MPRRFWGTELRGPSWCRQRPRGEYRRQGQDRCSRRVRLSRYRQPQDNLTERTHRAAHAAPPGWVAGASLEGLQGGGVEGGREEGKNRDRRRVEQGRTRQRPRSQPLSHEYYRSLFLFGIRGRYVSPGVCVGCCLGEDTKLAVAPLTQSLSSRPRGRRPPRGRRRHAMAVGALAPPDAARVATRIATVYTNAPKRHREAVFADLCTLLRLHGRSRDRTASRVPRRRRPHGPHEARTART